MAYGLEIFGYGLAIQLNIRRYDMPLCGMNNTMADGLSNFGQGLAVQTEKRAVEERVSLSEIPTIELEEVRTLLSALRKSPKQAELCGIIGLTMLVEYLYGDAFTKRLEKNPQLTAKQVIADIIEEQNKLLFAMEEHYYEKLWPNFPRLEAIRRIRNFLEEQVG